MINIKYLTNCRKNKGYYLCQIADILEVSRTAVTYWELGKRVPKAEIIIKLCKLLDMDANILLNLEEE